METTPAPAPHRADTVFVEQQLLEQLNNPVISRIVISGKFGSGKTDFLNRFFDTDYPDNYLTVRLNPIKYSISSNDDIIRLIKYDILKELMFLEPDVFKEFAFDSSTDERESCFTDEERRGFRTLILTGLVPVIASIAAFKFADIGVGSAVAASGTVIGSFLHNLREFHKSYRERREKLSSSDLEKFILDTEALPIEEVYLPHYITKLLNYILSETRENKKRVLIIDDMDRLDPDSIFRVLNIFAHEVMGAGVVDTYTKFGFDKIILVCDKNNLEKAYVTRYGGADFNGYFEKFYSRRLIDFNLSKSIDDYIGGILMNHLSFDNSELSDFVKVFTPQLLKNDLISLRKYTVLLDSIGDDYISTPISIKVNNYDQGNFYLTSNHFFVKYSQFLVENNKLKDIEKVSSEFKTNLRIYKVEPMNMIGLLYFYLQCKEQGSFSSSNLSMLDQQRRTIHNRTNIIDNNDVAFISYKDDNVAMEFSVHNRFLTLSNLNWSRYIASFDDVAKKIMSNIISHIFKI